MALILLAILIGILCRLVYIKETVKYCRSRKSLNGQTCLVTGGTSGLGLEIAIDLASRGARVIVACPFQEEGVNGLKTIIEESENENVVFKLLNLDDFQSVRLFAKDILKTEERLDILVNNAGIGGPNSVRVNYLGHFLLTVLLLPLLKKTGTPSSPSRIVNTVSKLYILASTNVDDLLMMPNISSWFSHYKFSYANSKLLMVLFSRELQKRFPTPNVVINNADPSTLRTKIFLKNGNLVSYLVFAYCRFLAKTPYEGAQTAIYVALDKKPGESNGLMYRNCTLEELSTAAKDAELARKAWDESVKLVGLTDEELNYAR